MFIAALASLGLLSGPPCVVLPEERGGWRPGLSGPAQTLEVGDGQITLHWTDEGQDAIGLTVDEDGNGLPDGIDRMVVGLETGLDSYEAAGWRPLVMDQGEDGTESVDVYVRDIEAFGYAYAEPLEGGGSCFMELDPHNHSLGEGMSESVAAHELHHCIQYAYTWQASSWIYEATATYQQYLLFSGPTIDTALQALWSQRLLQMDRAIDATGDRYEYAGFVFLKYLADRGESADLPALWEALAVEHDWLLAFEAESARKWDETFAETFSWFATWNLFACDRDDGQHYDPATHPCLLEGDFVGLQELGPEVAAVHFDHQEVTHTAAFAEQWFGFEDDRPPELVCGVAPGEAEALLVLVEVDGYGAQAQAALGSAVGGQELRVRLSARVDAAGSLGIISTSVGAAPAVVDCAITRVEPVEEAEDDGEGCTCGSTVATGHGRALSVILVLLVALRGRLRPR